MKKLYKSLIVVLIVLCITCLLFACTPTTDEQNNDNNQNTTDNIDNPTDDNGDDNNSSTTPGTTPELKPSLGNNNVFVFEPIVDTKTCYLKAVSIVNPVVEIPATNNGLTVVKIAPQVFYSNEMVREVSIPDTIVEIGERAFSLCVNLEKVNISASSQLKKIGARAFFSTERLHTINLPSELLEVGDEAFSGCIDLLNLTFPNSLVKVGANAFHAGWFHSITENKVLYVGKVAYAYIPESDNPTIKDITLNDDTISIASKAFYDNDYISSISIPASVSYIGALALNNSGALNTISVDNANEVYSSEGNALIEKDSATLIATTPSTIVPAYVETIGEEAFAYLEGITNITLPDSVKVIGKGAFKGSKVVNVNIPHQVTTIEEDTFLSCDMLESITIHANISTIKSASFNYCTALKVVVVESETIYDILDTPFACSGLIARADVVYVLEGLEGQADQLFTGFNPTTSDRSGYTKYVKEI